MKNLDKKIQLLNLIREAASPIGASYISQKANLPPATIGRMLSQLEQQGYLMKISNKGRQLTESGKSYLEQQNQINSKMETACSLIRFVEEISKEKLLEILEIRKLLECRSIELACINATEAQLSELDLIMLEHIHQIKNGGLGNEQDLRLHLTIAEMSENTTLYQILKLILTEQNSFTRFSYVAAHVKNTQLKQHDQIVETIRLRNPELAKAAMLEHLNQVVSDVHMYYEEQSDDIK